MPVDDERDGPPQPGDLVIELGPGGAPTVVTADPDEPGVALAMGWTDLQRLHALEERRLRHRLHTPSIPDTSVHSIGAGQYHVRSGNRVGRAHIIVRPDGSGFYINSRGERRSLTPRQVKAHYDRGFQHRRSPLTVPSPEPAAPPSPAQPLGKMSEAELEDAWREHAAEDPRGAYPKRILYELASRTRAAEEQRSPVPQPEPKRPPWVVISDKVKVNTALSRQALAAKQRGIKSESMDTVGRTVRLQRREVEGAMEHQSRYAPRVVNETRVSVAHPDRYHGPTNAVGLHVNDHRHIVVDPAITKAVDATQRGPGRPSERHKMQLTTNWWTPVGPDVTYAEHVTGHEVGHAAVADMASHLPVHQRYRSYGNEVPGDPLFWLQLQEAMLQESSGGATNPDLAIQDLALSRPGRLDSVTNGTFDTGELERWIGANRPLIEATVSKYAAAKGDVTQNNRVVGQVTSPHELLAELWAEYTLHPHPRAPAMTLGDYIMRYSKDRNRDKPVDILAPHTGTWPAREVF